MLPKNSVNGTTSHQVSSFRPETHNPTKTLTVSTQM